MVTVAILLQKSCFNQKGHKKAQNAAELWQLAANSPEARVEAAIRPAITSVMERRS